MNQKEANHYFSKIRQKADLYSTVFFINLGKCTDFGSISVLILTKSEV